MKTENNNTAGGISQVHKIFIREMIIHGNRRLAYQAAFPLASDNTARINACKLMKDPDIVQSIEHGVTEVAKLRAQHVSEKDIRKLQRLSVMRETLERIMNGELVTKTIVTNKTGKVRYIKTSTDVQAMIKAIRNDEKLEERIDMLDAQC